MAKKSIKIKDFGNVEIDGQSAGSLIDVIKNYSGDLAEIQAALNVFEGKYNFDREKAVKEAEERKDSEHRADLDRRQQEHDEERRVAGEALQAAQRKVEEKERQLKEQEEELKLLAGSDLPAAKKHIKNLKRQQMRDAIAKQQAELAKLGTDED